MKLALALLTAGPALAQTPDAPLLQSLQRVPAPPKFAGVYHLSTGVVTRPHRSVAAFGISDTIYACTAQTPYFTPTIGPTGLAAGGVLVDSGGLPGPQNTYVSGTTKSEYYVEGFSFAYCDLDATGLRTGWVFSFYDDVAPCTSVLDAQPERTFVLGNLNTSGCWIYDIDLTGSGFCLGADGGDAVFDDDADLDSFGWSLQYWGTAAAAAGPLVASDPSATDSAYLNPNGPNGGLAGPPAPAPIEGTATLYNPLSNCTAALFGGLTRETGSGFFSQDGDYVEDLADPSNSGCYYFGGYFNQSGTCGASSGGGNRSYASFYMELEGTQDCADLLPCHPTPCPATTNSTGLPGRCIAVGSDVLSDDDFTLRAENLPTQPRPAFGLFLHGLTDISTSPIQSGNGVLCIANAGRLDLTHQIRQADANGVAELSSSNGDLDLSALPIGNAPYSTSAYAGRTHYFAFWHRDVTPSAPPFNYTSSCQTTWH